MCIDLQKTQDLYLEGLKISDYRENIESKEYGACEFKLGGKRIHFRLGKITPKKIGQFTTFWKRGSEGQVAPYTVEDHFDYLMVGLEENAKNGVFLFSKEILVKKGILSKLGKEGKRAMRIYPPWSDPISPQAKKTKDWQSKFFLTLPLHLFP